MSLTNYVKSQQPHPKSPYEMVYKAPLSDKSNHLYIRCYKSLILTLSAPTQQNG